MRMIRDFTEANEALAEYIGSTRRPKAYKLDKMIRLMKYLGDPQNKLKVIHVAGTSGKTSTCYYISSLLHEAGYNVGLTVSPHIDGVEERAQINLKPLDEIEYCQELVEFLDIVDGSGIKPSYFEILVAFAYWLFEKHEVDYAVVEVGLGGLLDGTNVVDRADKVCVITDIGLDHTEILGNTLAEIARQKAGIIKQDNYVLVHYQSPQVIKAIQEIAETKQAKMEVVKTRTALSNNRLPLFQQHNFHIAERTVDYVMQRDDGSHLNDKERLNGAELNIPARMEIIKYKSKTLIIDGSHNPQKIGALCKSMKERFGREKIAMLVSCKNKSAVSVESLTLLRELSDTVIFTSLPRSKTATEDIERIKQDCQKLGFRNMRFVNGPKTAFRQLLEYDEKYLLVTGSFYLLNHVRPIIAGAQTVTA